MFVCNRPLLSVNARNRGRELLVAVSETVTEVALGEIPVGSSELRIEIYDGLQSGVSPRQVASGLSAAQFEVEVVMPATGSQELKLFLE